MRPNLLTFIFLTCLELSAHGQQQGFFLDNWQPETISPPAYTDQEQTNDPVTVSIKVVWEDTLGKISSYLFGDNANLWTGCMSDNT